MRRELKLNLPSSNVVECAKADHVFFFSAKQHSQSVYPSLEQDYFTPRELARLLRVDYTTVMRWIRTGLLPVETIREGRRNRHRIKKATIDILETPSPRFV